MNVETPSPATESEEDEGQAETEVNRFSTSDTAARETDWEKVGSQKEDEKSKNQGNEKEPQQFTFSSLAEAVESLDSTQGWEKIESSKGGDVLRRSTQEWMYKDANGNKSSMTAEVKGKEIEERHTKIVAELLLHGFAVSEFEKPEENLKVREVYFADEKGNISYEIYNLKLEPEAILPDLTSLELLYNDYDYDDDDLPTQAAIQKPTTSVFSTIFGKKTAETAVQEVANQQKPEPALKLNFFGISIFSAETEMPSVKDENATSASGYIFKEKTVISAVQNFFSVKTEPQRQAVFKAPETRREQKQELPAKAAAYQKPVVQKIIPPQKEKLHQAVSLEAISIIENYLDADDDYESPAPKNAEPTAIVAQKQKTPLPAKEYAPRVVIFNEAENNQDMLTTQPASRPAVPGKNIETPNSIEGSNAITLPQEPQEITKTNGELAEAIYELPDDSEYNPRQIRTDDSAKAAPALVIPKIIRVRAEKTVTITLPKETTSPESNPTSLRDVSIAQPEAVGIEIAEASLAPQKEQDPREISSTIQEVVRDPVFLNLQPEKELAQKNSYISPAIENIKPETIQETALEATPTEKITVQPILPILKEKPSPELNIQLADLSAVVPIVQAKEEASLSPVALDTQKIEIKNGTDETIEISGAPVEDVHNTENTAVTSSTIIHQDRIKEIKTAAEVDAARHDSKTSQAIEKPHLEITIEDPLEKNIVDVAEKQNIDLRAKVQTEKAPLKTTVVAKQAMRQAVKEITKSIRKEEPAISIADKITEPNDVKNIKREVKIIKPIAIKLKHPALISKKPETAKKAAESPTITRTKEQTPKATVKMNVQKSLRHQAQRPIVIKDARMDHHRKEARATNNGPEKNSLPALRRETRTNTQYQQSPQTSKPRPLVNEFYRKNSSFAQIEQAAKPLVFRLAQSYKSKELINRMGTFQNGIAIDEDQYINNANKYYEPEFELAA